MPRRFIVRDTQQSLKGVRGVIFEVRIAAALETTEESQQWLVEFDSFSISFAVSAIANVIALSVIFAYLYHRSSESLPVVILLHTTYDVVATQASLLVPHLDMYINCASLVLSACFSVVFGRALWRMSGTRDMTGERVCTE